VRHYYVHNVADLFLVEGGNQRFNDLPQDVVIQELVELLRNVVDKVVGIVVVVQLHVVVDVVVVLGLVHVLQQ